MTYGKNSEKVQEVIDFVGSARILNITPAITDPSVIIENDLDRALYKARTQEIDEYGDEGKLTWEDIRSEELSYVNEKMYKLSDFSAVKKELTQLLTTFFESLSETLPEQYEATMNEIIGDMYACARARAVDEDGSPFFERLLKIYQSGGWPCGWEGRYPEGTLVVFVPVSEKQ